MVLDDLGSPSSRLVIAKVHLWAVAESAPL